MYAAKHDGKGTWMRYHAGLDAGLDAGMEHAAG
jgi:hypothetical protein